ncbi:AT-rich interactive domain-containing protein 4B isoform X1 [Clupea harengus]|uniref:AT-rich interactive domain-containing protein 4B n=1 Tax=Clupea harengus TaxID=7950 RepID=A0A6P8GIB3_CLUHA|nr:AT-rich interactive domain-containing protein 4B isoform X1 [Clupea harengus]
MKTLEEPPYLTVGTDVSAKYRGAFCEAKIKTAKRLVKAKVTFKPDASTAEVHDEHIRGLLKVGAVVEVKNQDGVYQEATINKLTDASLYTVVFDDGDEKTLRRSSLCLKGARHFAESETLDRLPLTNPEHFGTPVIGKKSNRGRRSNPVQEEESSSSSSEEEEGDQRQNDDLFGKVVCVEVVATGDKKKTSWYPALVITPDCHEDVALKKDTIFVRSFKDGKFTTVLRKDVQELDGESAPKADAALKAALDAAWDFKRNATVPTTWRTEVKDESSSSEDDEDEEEEEQDEEGSSEEEEEEVEPFPEERESFLQQLYKFMEDRGTPINKRPVLGYRNLNLFKLFRLVHKLEGFDKIDSGSVWKLVYQDLGIPVLNSAAGYNVKCAYRKYLYGFEEYCTSTGITFRMDLPLKSTEKPGAKGEGKVEGGGAGAAAGARSVTPATHIPGEEQKMGKEGEPSSSQPAIKEEPNAEAGDPNQSAEKEDESNHRATANDDDDDEEEEDEEEDDDDDDDDEHDDDHEDDDEEEMDCNDEGGHQRKTGAAEQGDDVKMEPYMDSENKDLSGADSSQEGEEGEEFECYPPGMKVQVRYGRGRNLKTYEATVKESDLEGGEVLYLVHYCGWNVRYDEWVKADKIVRPANKNVSKIKHRKKIKNKAEKEKDRIERLSDKEDLTPSKANRLSRSSKPNAGSDVFTKMEDCDAKGNLQTPVKSSEIKSILNGLQGSESSTDDSEREEEDEAEHDGVDSPVGSRGSHRKGNSSESPHPLECWEGGPPSDGFKASPATGNGQEASCQEGSEPGKRRAQFEPEGESGPRKRKAESAADRTPKSQAKNKSRSTRAGDWLPGGSPKKQEERTAGDGQEQGEASSSSSEDEGASPTESTAKEEPRGHPKAKGSPAKKYNGLKEKSKGGRSSSAFWEIPDKRAKVAAGGAEERQAGCRTKGQKDVWSSIQAQWPKKTLKELFSDSDTEAQSSPPPAVATPEEPRAEAEHTEEDEPAEEELMEEDKMQEYPSSSGSNSVLNTPPTTPESPALSSSGGGGGGAMENSGRTPACSSPVAPAQAPATPASGSPAVPSPARPQMEEGRLGRSESDSSTVEVESLGGESQEMTPHEERAGMTPQEERAGSPSKAFDTSLSCNSNSNCSLELSNSSQQESEQKSKASATQKRHKESQGGVMSKKHKRSHKSLGLHPKKNRKAAHSSDSEDQSVSESPSKSPTTKHNASDLKPAISPKCPGRTPPSGHKYKHGDSEPTHHRGHHGRAARVYKWSFQMSDLEKMNSLEKISFLQEKLQDIRNHYLSLKSEVASIDRRRKRMKKKERETGAAAASSSSSSSSPSSSSLTAAVMLTLAEPTVSAQNSGVSVECR